MQQTVPPNYDENSNNTPTGWAAYRLMQHIRCVCCYGRGHVAYRCPTKKALDRIAKMADIKLEWGKVKSDLMFKSYADQTKLVPQYYTHYLQKLRATIQPNPPQYMRGNAR